MTRFLRLKRNVTTIPRVFRKLPYVAFWDISFLRSYLYHWVPKSSASCSKVNANLMSNTGSACAITRTRGSWKSAWQSRSNWNLEMLVFEERRKTSRSKEENQQQTQPTYDTGFGNRTRVTLVEGECSHHCAIPAPQVNLWIYSPIHSFIFDWFQMRLHFNWCFYTCFILLQTRYPVNVKTKAPDAEILLRSLVTASTEKCAIFARDLVVIVVSFSLYKLKYCRPVIS